MKAAFQSVAGYALRPSLWPTIPSLVSRTLFPAEGEATGPIAKARCAREAIECDRLPSVMSGFVWTPFEDAEPELARLVGKARTVAPQYIGGGADMSFLYSMAQSLKAKHVVETGVALGDSSLAILASVSKRSGGKLVSVDRPYLRLGSEKHVGAAVPLHLRSCWELIREADRSGIGKALGRLHPLDMCHYDSDKSYSGRMFGYSRLWQALRSGGVFISDDIQDNLAFFHFSETVQHKYSVVKSRNKYIGFMVKTSPERSGIDDTSG
ncbi:SAM-dependent methyltransferase protein (plasmid) [Rhizobium etli 8C-3]|uniref:SAM-dependent methyltransferase protein n=3 Tax=Rhizobium TaxID=379 RepID=A0A1L5PFM0_RHIET|nr:class I SAM-dependent methyltransferase [Rhizobium etli]APO78935.1 SAM-dependent methyltransferase protein [Rhizobium etli 8C-3]TCU28908.1 methyltransferase family protein [Rhizobium azibense]